jgi:hypothetical protein
VPQPVQVVHSNLLQVQAPAQQQAVHLLSQPALPVQVLQVQAVHFQ